MFDDRHYVPILRAKQAEFGALQSCPDQAREMLTPLIEAAPIAWDPGDEDAKDLSPDPSLAGLGRKLEDAWGTERDVFLDLGLVPSELALGGGKHPVAFVAEDARKRGLQIIPVTSPRRDVPFQDAIKQTIGEDGHGVCVRLEPEDFEDLEGAVEDTDDLLADLGVRHADADLILDFREVDSAQTGSMTLAGVAVVNGITTVAAWRTLTWAGTAFPRVGDFSANTVNSTGRAEWVIWQALRGRALTRPPAFADYVVNGVQTAYDVAASFYRSSPNLRYTTAGDYVVLKAAHPRHGHEQFNDLCRVMVDRSDYAGADFSVGDAYVAACAAGTDGPGNAVTWRRAGISHHLSTVPEQLASLPGT